MRGEQVAPESHVRHGAELAALAEAVVGRDDGALAQARERLRACAGDVVMSDAAAVAANFQRMVRIADATGIPLESPMALLSHDVRRVLGMDRYRSAANSSIPTRVHLAGQLLRPVANRLLRLLGRLTGG